MKRHLTLEHRKKLSVANQKPKVSDPVAYFWTKVIKTDYCWLWQGSLAKGYGQIRLQALSEIKSHRISWVLAHGKIPNGMKVLHSCDVRNCVNPAHLFLGTTQDNIKDKIEKSRHKGWKLPFGTQRGEKNSHAKLTNEQVQEIRTRYSNGETNQSKLAREYEVGQPQIWRIVNHWQRD